MDSFKIIYEKMCEYHECLLASGHLSDVVLVAGDKAELKAHKVILSARSPVFAAMFAHKSTKEAQENRVEILDVDVEVLELMVRYIYSGKVDNLDQYAEDLLIAADKYQVDCLKSICEQHLLSHISTESVSDLLILADVYQATELYRKCVDNIAHNCTEVIASNGWKKNIEMNVDFVAKMYRHLHLKYSHLVTGIKSFKGKKWIEANRKFLVRPDLVAKICDRLEWDFTEQLLLCPITVETVSSLFILADMHRENELTSECVDYITDNGTQVMREKNWKKIVVRADLLVMLLERLSEKYVYWNMEKSISCKL